MMMPASHDTVRFSLPKNATGMVLLIEDDETLARALTRIITSEGYQVVHVTNGASAIEKVMHRSFDAVISDLHLPGASGVDVLNIVRAYDPDVSLVLMSGSPSVDSAIEAMHLGVLDYVVKPASREQVASVLERATAARKAAAERRELATKARVLAASSSTVSNAETVRPPDITVVPGSIPTVAELRASQAAPATLRATYRTQSGTCQATKMLYERAVESLGVELDPIVDAATRKLVGFATRMVSNEESLATDAALVAAAQRVGRLADLRRRARDLAVKAFAAAPPESLLFVDIHPSELVDGDLYSPAPELSRLADRIVLQVRADGLATIDLSARASVLRFVGFRVAIADLDAGQCLAQIADLSPDFVKIDARLVRGVNTSLGRRRIVRALVSMCRALDAVVVAEGVSTAEERDALLDAGCSFVQGSLVTHKGSIPVSRRLSLAAGAH